MIEAIGKAIALEKGDDPNVDTLLCVLCTFSGQGCQVGEPRI